MASGASPFAVSPVDSPGGPAGPHKSAVAATPKQCLAQQPTRSSAFWADEAWTDQVFSVDFTVGGTARGPTCGCDASALPGSDLLVRLELETGTVITIRPAVQANNPASGPASVTICGDLYDNVLKARGQFESMVASLGALPKASKEKRLATRRQLSLVGELGSGSAAASPGPTSAASTQCEAEPVLFSPGYEEDLRQILQDGDDESERLARELQLHEDARENHMRREEEAGARLAVQLFESEASRHRLHQESVLRSNEFFAQLPDGFTTCPKCNVIIEKIVDSLTMGAVLPAPGSVLPKGATLDALSAEQHKCGHRFCCSQCTAEFCGECGAEPYHYGFDCSSFQDYLAAQRCRFCGDLAKVDGCCGSEQCKHYLSFASCEVLSCGHQSLGLVGDKSFPCIEDTCVNRRKHAVSPSSTRSAVVSLSSTTASTQVVVTSCADDWCVICYVAQLREAPCVALSCGHVFHAECLRERLTMGRPRARLSFNFLNCPTCSVRIDSKTAKIPFLAPTAEPHIKLELKVQKKALQRWSETVEAVSNNDKVQQARALSKAMRRFSYYPCSVRVSMFCRVKFSHGACEIDGNRVHG